ncbi:MAG: type II toxin-antitoxin system VapC family toxin [Chloroflexota bacterium]|nr:type II toxin-antitoxin system VapC family toxin [Chloroflexota bacterium]
MTSPPRDAVLYFDTSALVKRYAAETGSNWVTASCHPSTKNTIATARITKAEAAAAFASKRRSRGLSQMHYGGVLRDLAHDFVHQYLLVEVDQTLVDLAVDLTKRQKLRGYDAVQLAAALSLDDMLTQAQFPPLIFVAADNDLLDAARSEGLTTDNPDRYP